MAVHDPHPPDKDPRPAGDEAMAGLVERVRRAVERSCPPYLASQAEDIAQEVLLQLHRNLLKIEGQGSYSSIYLLKAAHGATVDEIRRRCRRRERPGMEDKLMVRAWPAPDPEQESIGRSLGREIRDCLSRLIPSRRTAVTLHLLGCPIPEVARRLGCGEKSADNRVYRGMNDLRQCLAAKGLAP
jgi:RNA polymerase sigma-70 factor (ECF subfamily)